MFNFEIATFDWVVLMPILLVGTGGILALIAEIVARHKSNLAVMVLSLVSLIAAGGWLVRDFGSPEISTLNGLAIRDGFSLMMQLLIVGASFFTVLFSQGYLHEKRIAYGEFYPLLLWSTCGAMIMVSTHSLLMLFIGLEVLSIALYVLAGLCRREMKSQEAAIKYFLLGAFASAFLLYGSSFIYGATGSLSLASVPGATVYADPVVKMPLVFGTALILVGLGFKAALAPFHQWTPDVYEGAPTNVTAFMATVSKIAVIGALYRVLDSVAFANEIWIPILSAIAALTMVVGNVGALLQSDIKRMLGYSSIANAGYMLVGLIAHLRAPADITASGLVVFLAGYALMSIGTFAVLTQCANKGMENTSFESLNGLYKREPFAAIALIIFTASMIGIPPTAGFIGKLLIFGDALGTGLGVLAVIMAVTSVISAFYYIRLWRAAFVDESRGDLPEPSKMGLVVRLTTVLCLVGVIAMAWIASPVSEFFKGNNPGNLSVKR